MMKNPKSQKKAEKLAPVYVREDIKNALKIMATRHNLPMNRFLEKIINTYMESENERI